MKTTSESVDWLDDEIAPNSIPSDWDRESGTQADRWSYTKTDLSEIRTIVANIFKCDIERQETKNSRKKIERQCEVLLKRFGLDGNGARTLEAIGKEIGVGVEQARRIEAAALRAMRHPTRIKQLESFFYGGDIKLQYDSGGRIHVLKTSAGIEITMTLNEETGEPTMSFDPHPPFAVALLDSIKVEFLPWFNDIRKKWMQRTGKTVELAK